MSITKDKFCSQCGKEVKPGDLFCPHCGHKSVSTLEDAEVSEDSSVPHVISVPKFLFLSLLTFGMYQFYWGWKNWEIVKRAKDMQVSPTARGIFIVFTSFGLFKNILSLSTKHGYKGGYIPWLVGAGFLALNLIANGLGNSEEIGFTHFLVAYAIIIGLISLLVSPVINAMNYFLTHNNEDTSKFDIGRNYLLIVFLIIITLAVVSFGFFEGLMTAEYDETTRAQFMSGCNEGGGDELFCNCFYEEIKSRYTFQEFAGFGLRGETPPDIEDITNACVN